MNSEERREEEDQKPEEQTDEVPPVEEPAGGAGDPGDFEEPEPEAFPDGTQPDDVDGDNAEASTNDDGSLEIEALRDELEATRLERDQYRDDMMYMRAEFDNARKRQERERERTVRSASESLVRELLPVLDNLERSLEVEGDVREGVRATLEQFASVLGDEGLSPVDSDGQPFDPNIHEAVMSQPSDEHEENIVLQTFQRGYMLNGKPIRTAKVVVAK